jgi:hypothetical protein
MDPLALLREFNTGRKLKQVAVSGDRINFGDQYSYPKSTPTAFKSSRGDHYSLETVLHYLSGKALSAAEYVKECSKTGILPVMIQDRKVRPRGADGRLQRGAASTGRSTARAGAGGPRPRSARPPGSPAGAGRCRRRRRHLPPPARLHPRPPPAHPHPAPSPRARSPCSSTSKARPTPPAWRSWSAPQTWRCSACQPPRCWSRRPSGRAWTATWRPARSARCAARSASCATATA